MSLQAELKLAEHLKKMAEEGQQVDLMELRRNINRLKKGRYKIFLGDFDFDALEKWIKEMTDQRITILCYETSL